MFSASRERRRDRCVILANDLRFALFTDLSIKNELRIATDSFRDLLISGACFRFRLDSVNRMFALRFPPNNAFLLLILLL